MKKHFIIGSWLVLSLALLTWPQVQGKIEGTVTDKNGQPLAGVTVNIISTKMATRHFERKTDKNGKFVQIGLWPGYYQVTFKKEGYLPATKEVKVSIGESTRLNVKLEKAEKALEKTLSKADQFFLKGNKLYAANKFEEAAAAFQEAISLNANQWSYYFNLGLCFKKMGQTEKALQVFQKSLEFNPESFVINKELGEALAKLGQYQKANEHFQKAVELNQDDPDVYYNYGVVLINLGKSNEAMEALQRTIQLKPDYADAYYQLGTLYIGQNKIQEAINALNKFIELVPADPKVKTAEQFLKYLKK